MKKVMFGVGLLCLGFGVVLSGCSVSSGSYLMRSQVSHRASGFTRVYIRQFSSVTQKTPPKVMTELQERFAKKIIEEKIFSEAVVESTSGLKGYWAPVRSEEGPAEAKEMASVDPGFATSANTLLFEGSIMEFNPGSRTKRYFGAGGKGKITIEVRLLDPKTKEDLGKVELSGEVSGGAYGGGMGRTYARLSEELARFFKSEVFSEPKEKGGK